MGISEISVRLIEAKDLGLTPLKRVKKQKLNEVD